MLRTTNPALNAKVLKGVERSYGEDAMTVNGAINKTGILLLLVVLSASWVWRGFYAQSLNVMTWMLVGIIGGLIAAIVTIFKKEWSPVSAPVYAILEGFALGGISAIFQKQYPGIAFQAVLLTFAVLICMLIAYRTGMIKVTEKFRAGIIAATFGIFIFYMLTMVLSLFGVRMPIYYGNSMLSIGISVFIVIIAALNLVLDFDFFDKGTEAGLPKYMEWYAAFGLMVTLIWLYLEILRLLAKINSRR